MKISTRINGRVTSINVRNSILALHFIITGEGNPQDHALDTCHTIISQWDGTTAKGLSSFITDKIIEDVLSASLSAEDLKEFNQIKERFQYGN